MRSDKEIFCGAIIKISHIILMAFCVFVVVLGWSKTAGQSLMADFESGFGLRTLKIAAFAVFVYIIICLALSLLEEKIKSRFHLIVFAIEAFDDFAGVLAASGSVALIMALNGRGGSLYSWAVWLILIGFAIKLFCGFQMRYEENCIIAHEESIAAKSKNHIPESNIDSAKNICDHQKIENK